jgi:hypothetical protein
MSAAVRILDHSHRRAEQPPALILRAGIALIFSTEPFIRKSLSLL